MKTARIFGISSLFCAAVSSGAGAGGPEAKVSVTNAEVTVDGKLTEPCWQRDADFADFKLLDSDKSATQQTEAWLARDDTWLYVGFKCHDPAADRIACRVTERDASVHQDESVEIFISPGTSGRTYYHFIVTATGLQGDNRSVGEDHNVDWDGHWRSAATIDAAKKCWYAEVAVPLFYLSRSEGEREWSFNLCRERWHEKVELSSWSSLKQNFHRPELFGRIEGLARLKPRDVFAPVMAGAKVGELLDLPDRCYKVTVTLKNQGKLPGTVNVFARDITKDGDVTLEEPNVHLGPGHARTVEITVPVKEFVQRRTQAGLLLKDGLSKWEFVKGVGAERSTQPLIVCMDRSFYTTEEKGGLICDLDLPEQVIRQCSLRIKSPFLQDDMVQDVQQASTRAALPIENLEPGTHEINVELRGQDGKAIARESCMLVKRRPPPPGGSEVKTDRWNRCVLVNGEPFFPVGHFSAPPTKMVAEMGANTVIPWWQASPEQFRGMLDEAHRHGLRVFIPPELTFGRGHMACTDPRFPERIRSGIEGTLPELMQKAANHPALLAWYTVDEPGGEALRKVIQELRDALMEGDGYHPGAPLFCRSFPKDDRWLQTIDLGLVDIYWHPTRKGDMHNTVEWLARGQRTVRHWNMPYWLAIVSEFISGSHRSMLPREQRVNTYLALIHDASAVFYFVWPIRHVETHAMFRTLYAEISELAPSLLLRPPRQNVRVTGGNEDTVKLRLKRHPKDGYILLAANTTDAPVDVSITIPGLRDGAEVGRAFAQEKLRVRDGAFTDRLAGYASRAYLITERAARIEEPVAIELALVMEGEQEAEQEPQKARNLIPNHSFEEDRGWRDVKPGGAISFDSTVAQEGKRSLRITRVQGAETMVTVSDKITLKPHTSYRFGAWLRGKFTSAPPTWGGPDLSIHSLSANKTKIFHQTHVKDLATWCRRSGTFSTGPEAETVQCCIYGGRGKYVGTAWVDGVVAEAAVQGKNLAPNSSFEYASLPGYPARWINLFKLGGEDRLTGGKEPALTMDEQVAYEGRHSLRLRGFHQLFTSPSRHDRGTRANPEKTYVVSLYAKADQDDVECWLRVRGDPGNKWNRFKVGKAWQRYHAVGKPHPKGRAVHVAFRTEGAIQTPWDKAPTVWLDAVQYEEGETPTEYVRDRYAQE